MGVYSLYRSFMGLMLTLVALDWISRSAESFGANGFQISRVMTPVFPEPWPSILLGILVLFSFSMMVGILVRYSKAVVFLVYTYFFMLDTVAEKSLYSILLFNLFVMQFIPDHREPFKKWSPLPLRIFQIHHIQMYFFAGLIKANYTNWPDGSVIQRILQGRFATDFGRWLSGTLPPFLFSLAGKATVFFEVGIGFLLVFPKTRKLGIAVGILFHIMIDLTLNVGFLSLYSILTLAILFGYAEGDLTQNSERPLSVVTKTPSSSS